MMESLAQRLGRPRLCSQSAGLSRDQASSGRKGGAIGDDSHSQQSAAYRAAIAARLRTRHLRQPDHAGSLPFYLVGGGLPFGGSRWSGRHFYPIGARCRICRMPRRRPYLTFRARRRAERQSQGPHAPSTHFSPHPPSLRKGL